MKKYIQITEDLKKALKQKEKNSNQFPVQLEYAIGHCKIALNRLREHVIKEGFPDKASEIYFFKKIKPEVYSKMLFYQAVRINIPLDPTFVTDPPVHLPIDFIYNRMNWVKTEKTVNQ